MAKLPKPTPKIFRPQMGDVHQVEAHADFYAIDPSIVGGVAGSLHDILESPVYPGVTPSALTPILDRNLLERGGTLVAPEVQQLAEASEGFGLAFHGLQYALGHESSRSGSSIKVYAGKKMGKGAHRDANFDNAIPSVVDAIGIEGNREFALWAVPQTVELNRGDKDFMNTASRNRAIVEFPGALDADPYVFRPVTTRTLGPGEGVRIDEVNSTWFQPNGRQMALWHSVYGAPDIEHPGPVISAVFRSSNPSEIMYRTDVSDQPPRLF